MWLRKCIIIIIIIIIICSSSSSITKDLLHRKYVQHAQEQVANLIP